MIYTNNPDRPRVLTVPAGNDQASSVCTIDVPSHLIIIGANGSGKSRFAAAIENNLNFANKKVIRISAQRTVAIPDQTRLRALDDAIRELKEGQNYLYEQGGGIGKARRNDTENNLIRVLSDFEAVLGLLFARTAKVYKDHFQQGGEKPQTPIERLSTAWSSLLPERELHFDEEKMSIDVKNHSSDVQHHTSKMSDGERTVLYLLAQCLSAETGSVIIIDEPELHIHRSIVSTLFANLQIERPDCLFVYVTHDLEFAAGQPNARKIWLQSFRGNSWTWVFVPETEKLPERLLLEILGARKTVLFVEGGSTSDDRKVYDILFPEMTVIPCGSCDQVIDAVAVVKHQISLTRMHAIGLIDRDYRNEETLNNLKDKGVYSLEVAEVENLFCTEEVIDILADEFSSGNNRKADAKADIVRIFESQIERQIANSATFNIRSSLGAFAKPKEKGRDAFIEKYYLHLNSIDPNKIYDETEKSFSLAKDKGLKDILKVFNMKKLRNAVAGDLGVQPDVYLEKAMSMLQNEKSHLIKNAFRLYIPVELHSYMPEIT